MNNILFLLINIIITILLSVVTTSFVLVVFKINKLFEEVDKLSSLSWFNKTDDEYYEDEYNVIDETSEFDDYISEMIEERNKLFDDRINRMKNELGEKHGRDYSLSDATYGDVSPGLYNIPHNEDIPFMMYDNEEEISL